MIINLLADKEKIMLLSASKELNKLKLQFRYHEKTHINNKILNLPYFDNFESIRATSPIEIYPNCAKYVHFDYTFTNYLWDQQIPLSVTHITLSNFFTDPIKIPLSVTHVTIGAMWNRKIILGPSVTHLNIDCWDISMAKYIPSTVKHLIINRFDNSIKRALPPTITHLTLNHHLESGYLTLNHYLAPNRMESNSLTHLSFGDSFIGSYGNFISASVTHLSFGYSFTGCLDNMIHPSVVEIKIHRSYGRPISPEITSRVKIIRIE
jgi:hypothetical protein